MKGLSREFEWHVRDMNAVEIYIELISYMALHRGDIRVFKNPKSDKLAQLFRNAEFSTRYTPSYPPLWGPAKKEGLVYVEQAIGNKPQTRY